MNKKGLEYETLAIIIIILLSAAILIFFFTNFSSLFTQNVDRGTCRASVELRSAKIVSEATKIAIPLRCQSQYICLTMGGTCPEGYKTKITVKNEDDIKYEIASAMYDCWWQLGEGKLDFFGTQVWKEFGLGKVQSSCMICSEIAFDEKVKAKYPEVDLPSYLQTAVIPQTNISYAEYFTMVKGAVLPTDYKPVMIDTSQKYAILFMGIEGDALWEPFVHDLGLVASSLTFGALSIGPKNTFSVAKGAASLASKTLTISIGGGTALETAAGSAYTAGAANVIKIPYAGWIAAAVLVSAQTVNTYLNQAIVASYCDGKKKGCYNLIVVPYSAFDIGKSCSEIQSIP
jgi:hypothetical protein